MVEPVDSHEARYSPKRPELVGEVSVSDDIDGYRIQRVNPLGAHLFPCSLKLTRRLVGRSSGP